MPFVYWFADGVGTDMVLGADGRTAIVTSMVRWIRSKGSPSLIINGGDVYKDGNSRQFGDFFSQMDNDVTLMCETPGNHDWHDDTDVPGAGRIPHGYEEFWKNHPESKQPIDTTKQGAARYEHFIDINGWRFLFLDTGDNDPNPWPAGDPTRKTWLENNLKPGRANVVCAHHSRLSRGLHGNNEGVDALWQTLFDASGAPRAALTLGGHDHNVNMYKPRSKDDPEGSSVAFANGIHIVVNGAGGSGHHSSGLFSRGERADHFHDDDNFCVTRLNVIDAKSLDVDLVSFGPLAKGDPKPIPESLLKIRL